jgi:hypothetical protein
MSVYNAVMHNIKSGLGIVYNPIFVSIAVGICSVVSLVESMNSNERLLLCLLMV